jgi:hypothetical protein
MGFTGWLDPKGIFHPCKYGEHHVLAQEIVESDFPYSSYDKLKEQMNYIPMGVSSNESQSYVFILIDEKKLEPIITKEQIEWFKEHFNQLDKGQKTMVYDWLEDELKDVVSFHETL